MKDKDLILKYVPKDKQEEALKKLKENIPIQYIIGDVDFCGYKIKVDERVLIPRFETEFLVDKTVKIASKLFNKKLNILDLGTGSGCIAISLAKMLDGNVTAVDISRDALDLAKENAKLNNVDINFKKHDMTKRINGKYDIIISNPPYIPYDGYVEKIVKNNEPNIALFSKDEGIYFYKKILDYAFDILNKPGLIAFEIGDNEKNILEEYIKKFKKKYEFINDLNGLVRYLFIYNE